MEAVRSVLRFLADANIGHEVCVEIVKKKTPPVAGADEAIAQALQEAAPGLNLTFASWVPPSRAAASVATIERLASAAVLVLPTDTGRGALWRWAALLSSGVILAPADLHGVRLLAERSAAGAVVPWAPGLSDGESVDPKAFRNAWRSGCLTGWDGGDAAKAWEAEIL